VTREQEIEVAWTEHMTRSSIRRRALRRRLAEAQGWRCCYCGVRLNETACHPASATLEHVVPVSRGGLDHEHNLVVACLDCNAWRADKRLRIERELRA